MASWHSIFSAYATICAASSVAGVVVELGYNLNRAQVLADWAIDRVAQPSISKLYDEPPAP